LVCSALSASLLGCGGGGDGSGGGNGTGGGGGTGGGKRQFISMGTAPVGGAFNQVGIDISEVLNKHKGDNNWKVQAKGTKGSQENIRSLANGKLQIALSNAAITYFAVRGEGTWDKKYDIKVIATIAPNVAMFVTKADSGIKTVADLKGKRVITGPAGAGFEMFVGPILAAPGASFDDFGSKMNDTQSGAVDKLADGNADAAFLGGAVPTGAIVQACATHDIFFVPFDEAAKDKLIADYAFFQKATIPQDKYADLTADYHGLNVGSMHLITSGEMDEEKIYQITKTIWENRTDIKHPASKFINEKNAARNTGTDFHPGAIRFYKEIGIWPEESTEEAAVGNAEEAQPKETENTEKPAEEKPAEKKE